MAYALFDNTYRMKLSKAGAPALANNNGNNKNMLAQGTRHNLQIFNVNKSKSMALAFGEFNDVDVVAIVTAQSHSTHIHCVHLSFFIYLPKKGKSKFC